MSSDDQVTVDKSPTLRIGEVAKATGLTTRTLRYWEQLGLLSPSSHRESGERLYNASAIERVGRIRELQNLLGFSLAEVKVVLDAEDDLERIRSDYRANKTDPRRRRDLLVELIAANDTLLERLDDTVGRIRAFRDERADKGKRMRKTLRELDAEHAAPTR
ncbi:MAG TPA: MerR family transcriptional regulator [Acidimicrobiales bacterium]